jgi:hypothetical protein
MSVYELRHIGCCDKKFHSDACGSCGWLNRSGTKVFRRAVGAPTHHATP